MATVRKRRRRIFSITPIRTRRRFDAEASPPGDPNYTTTINWSDLSPAPTAGANVTIPSGWHVVLNTATPALASLIISSGGKLSEDPAALSLAVTAETIQVSGIWEIGREGQRFTKPYVITLTGAKPAGTLGELTSTVVRGIQVMGGKLHWFGDVSRKHRVRLNLTAAANATALMIEDASTGWKAGDSVAIGTTDFYNINVRTHRTTLAADASGFGITLSTGLNGPRYGSLQYVNDAGLSTTNGTFTPDPSWPEGWAIPRVLDERAMVVNTTRNIIVQGADDSAWANDGWGADVMVMGRADQMANHIKVSGVLFRRVGKRSVLGKYPFHWHMLSYSSYDSANPTTSGKAYYGLAEGHYIRDCAIEDSANRGIVVHGTNGVDVDRNVTVFVRGHVFFLENGSEMWNRLRDNVALLINDSNPNVGYAASDLQFNPDGTRTTAGVRLAKHEANNHVSAFWITNPKNEVTGNWCADGGGNGLWFSFAEKPFGPSRNVLIPNGTTRIQPSRVRHGLISGNRVQGMYRYGALTELPVTDEAGNFTNGGYTPKMGDVEGSAMSDYVISDFQIHKCGLNGPSGWSTGAYFNRVFPINYDGFLVTDCQQLGIHGSAEGSITRSTMVGTTLNAPTANTYAPRVGIATYHFSVGQDKCMFVNLPHNHIHPAKGDRDVGGGAMSLVDLYLYPVEIGAILNRGTKFVNSHPGYRCKPPWVAGRTENFTFSGALWDPHGYWGPAGSYSVYGNYAPQNAFFTHNAANVVANEPAANSGTVSTTTRFFGFGSFRTTENPTPYKPVMPLRVYRYSSASDLTVVGEWFVADGRGGGTLPWMHHFAAANGGVYRFTFPYSDSTPQAPSTFHSLVVHVNQAQAGDFVTVGVPWGASTFKAALLAKTGFTVPDNPANAGGGDGTPQWSDTTVNNLVAAGEALKFDQSATTVAQIADPVGNADCRKAYLDTAAKTLWLRLKFDLVYPGAAEMNAVAYPAGINPTKYLEKHRMVFNLYVLPA